jgi:hypothetical protein
VRLDDAGRGVGGAHDCWGPRVGENILQADRREQTEAQGVYEQERK